MKNTGGFSSDFEHYGPYIMECPECHEIVKTEPAEGVPDQSLRACPKCEAVFWIEQAA